MISVEETKNSDETYKCEGCGNVTDTFTKIKGESIENDYVTRLNICPACKTTLRDKLAISPKSFEFEHVRIVLEHEINILKADVKSLGHLWEREFGSPLTTERLEEQSTSILSMGYLHNLASIKECERILEA
ncbi:MAG: hypothetical protein KAS66_09050, partial [Candidatus Omnitrophica bacterium]|nr:hypothetical protein [Candidatus Omnitrophota bacterium]